MPNARDSEWDIPETRCAKVKDATSMKIASKGIVKGTPWNGDSSTMVNLVNFLVERRYCVESPWTPVLNGIHDEHGDYETLQQFCQIGRVWCGF